MKIDTSKSTAGIRSVKNLKTKNSVSGFSENLSVNENESVLPVSSPVNIFNSTDVLLIQEKNKETPKERGEKLLEGLDKLQNELIMGLEITEQNLEEMAKRLRDRKTKIEDPKLKNILDSIEQRVAIELAKRVSL